MARLLAAVREAADAHRRARRRHAGGEIEAAGYRRDLGAPLPLGLALRLAPPRRPASGRPWHPGAAASCNVAPDRRRRRPRQGPVRGPGRGAARRRLRRRLRRRHALRRAGAAHRGRRPVRRPAPARVRAARRRRGHQRDRPALLARLARAARAPPARSRDRRARVHRRRPGHRAGADRARGRVAREGRCARRPGRAATWLTHGGVFVLDDRSHHVIEPRHKEMDR